MHSGTVSLTITNVDMEIINFAYEFDYMEIANFRIYQKQYLPVEIIKSIIELYKNKTELKGVMNKETEYLVSKGLLNSIYGMMVTDIVREEVIYDGEWKTEPGDPSDQIEKYNNGRRRFLYYPWGVWCT